MVTQYRTIHYGDVEWLQYLRHRKFLFFKWDTWEYVRSDSWDFWDEQWELHDKEFGNSPSTREMEYRFINNGNKNIQQFVKEYPEISKWQQHRNLIVGEKRRREYENKRRIKEQKDEKKGL